MRSRRMKTATAARTTAGTTALVAAVTGERHHICWISITCSVFGASGAATAGIADSGTTYVNPAMKDGNGSAHFWNFGDDGIACAAGSAINLVTAGGENCSVVATIGYWTS